MNKNLVLTNLGAGALRKKTTAQAKLLCRQNLRFEKLKFVQNLGLDKMKLSVDTILDWEQLWHRHNLDAYKTWMHTTLGFVLLLKDEQ